MASDCSSDYSVPFKRVRVEGAKSGSMKEDDADKGVMTIVGAGKGDKLPGEVERKADDTTDGKSAECEYKIENSVIVNVQNNEIDEDDLIDSIEEVSGEDTVLACVPCGKDIYEVTMVNKNCSDILIPSLQVNGKTVSVNSVSESSTFVSILHLPTYVTDSEIVEKMNSYRIQIVSPIYRKFRRRKKKKRRVADGTRYFRVKFPKEIKSLPWSLSFEVKGMTRYYKTIHDNQLKVCFKCCAADHVARHCPLNRCYTCSEMGHISLFCPMKWCLDCNNRISDCECESGSSNDSEDSEHTSGEESDNENESQSEDEPDEMEVDHKEIEEKTERGKTNSGQNNKQDNKVQTDKDVIANQNRESGFEKHLNKNREGTYTANRKSQKEEKPKEQENIPGKKKEPEATLKNDNQTEPRDMKRMEKPTKIENPQTNEKQKGQENIPKKQKESVSLQNNAKHQNEGNTQKNEKQTGPRNMQKKENPNQIESTLNTKKHPELENIQNAESKKVQENSQSTGEQKRRRKKLKVIPNLNCARKKDQQEQQAEK